MRNLLKTLVISIFAINVGVSYASVNINKNFSLDIGFEEETTLCRLIFKPSGDKIIVGSKGKECHVEGDLETGFTVTLKGHEEKQTLKIKNRI